MNASVRPANNEWARADLISGRLTFMIQAASEVLPYIASGKLKALDKIGVESAPMPAAEFAALPQRARGAR